MRADRLLAILIRLQVHGRYTAKQLAEELEVSERTIYRDMEALSFAGLPVVAERGSKGGWYLLEGYRAQWVGLKPEEMQTLFLNQPLFADLGLGESAQNALLKLLANLPTPYRNQADLVRQRLYIDLSGWTRNKEDVHCLPLLQEALWKNCQVQMSYRRAEGETVERIISPLGLVAKGSVWYLVALAENDLRTYRVSRITDAQILDSPLQYPEDFVLADYWQQSMSEFKAQLPCYAIRVRVSPEILPRLRYAGTFAKIQQIHPPDDTGWSLVELCFDLPEEALEYALGFGIRLEVIAPLELREQVTEMAEQILRFYKNKPTH